MDKRPNILWISFEDTNPFYGCYGDKVARTPNLDKLASEGCVWPKAFSTAGVCAPARSAVITGMYPISIGTHHMRTTHEHAAGADLLPRYSAVIPHYVKCFSEYFRAAGYYCTNNKKTDYQFDPPFTAWNECSDTAHWRNRPDPDQPFFAVFNPCRTHESSQWPDKTPKITFDPDDMQLPPYFPDTPKVREAMARMYTRIEQSDTQLGELLAQLEEDGLADNTIVVHWSDHGPLPRGKRWPYDSGLHVPMIIRWPGEIEPGTISKQLVSTIDLAPSMLSAAGLPIPCHLQGRAFLGPKAEAPREYIYASRDRYDESYDMVRAVRDRRYKYIRHYCPEKSYLVWNAYLNNHPIVQEWNRLYLNDELTDDQAVMFQPRPAEELYDTEADPHELNNLADDTAHFQTLEKLRGALDHWIKEVGDRGEVPETEMVEQWYPNGKQPQTAAPIFIPISEKQPGLSAATGSVGIDAPAMVELHCPTQGASIGYHFGDGNWQLYTAPIRIKKCCTLHAKAIRIGYKPSDETTSLMLNVET